MGKLIVIEGVSDGVGKTTQVKELYNKLVKEGKEVVYHHFPSYGSVGASMVEEYLKGNLGKREDVGVYAISSFFAMDRFYAYHNGLKKALDEDKIVLLDRYTTSNLIYQGSLFEREKEEEFLDYITDYEYNKLGLRKPDLVIFLKLDKSFVTTLRKNRDNEGVEGDINESDNTFLDKVYDNSLYVADKYNFKVIECSSDGKLRSIDDISKEVYDIVRKELEL